MTKPRLIDQTRHVLRLFHYSIRTEETYVQWIKRFIFFHNKRRPKEMGEKEVTAFLTHLAVDKHVSASTQNQALSDILLTYRKQGPESNNYRNTRDIELNLNLNQVFSKTLGVHL